VQTVTGNASPSWMISGYPCIGGFANFLAYASIRPESKKQAMVMPS
jgi:hypothetical protein